MDDWKLKGWYQPRIFKAAPNGQNKGAEMTEEEKLEAFIATSSPNSKMRAIAIKMLADIRKAAALSRK